MLVATDLMDVEYIYLTIIYHHLVTLFVGGIVWIVVLVVFLFCFVDFLVIHCLLSLGG